VTVVWASNIRTSTGPAAGETFVGNATTVPATRPALRVGIFNIHGGRGTDHKRDLTRTADCLRQLDLIGMNEVLGPKLWWQTDQCEQLGEILGTRWLFAPTESRWWDGSFGNGLLCRMPVSFWQRIPLPLAGAHTHRNVVLSTIDVNGRSVHVLLTHLDSRDAQRRQEQLRIVGDLFLSLAPPAILMGDMNTLPDDPQLNELLGKPGVVDAVAAGMDVPPPRRIDWILTRGLQTVAAGCEDRGASDHPLYWAELVVAD
jgi:endonuclease/exonuclease/phosphatase family metal-dependent hydrolase